MPQSVRYLFWEVWRELTRAENYRRNWYGYATNQLSHMMLGFIYCCAVSAAHWAYYHEFAEKPVLWLFVAVTYAAFELGTQKWKGWDTVEDWMFFALYGGGVPVLIFTEIEAGNPTVTTSIEWAIPTVGIIFTHLVSGIVVRIVNGVRNGSD